MVDVQEFWFIKSLFPFRTLRSACLYKRGWRVPHQMNKNNVAKSWMEEIYAQIVILFVFGMSGCERKLFPCSFHFFLLHFLDLISLPTCHASTHLLYHRNHQNCRDVNILKFQSKKNSKVIMLWNRLIMQRLS